MIEKLRSIFLAEDESGTHGDLFHSNFFNFKRPTLCVPDLGWRPQTDLFETEDEVVVVVEVAGIEKKDISVILEKDILVVQGIRREDRGFKKRQYHDMEIEFGPFERILKLPSYVDQENVFAQYRNGFLEIRLKKSDSPEDRTEIKIK